MKQVQNRDGGIVDNISVFQLWLSDPPSSRGRQPSCIFPSDCNLLIASGNLDINLDSSSAGVNVSISDLPEFLGFNSRSLTPGLKYGINNEWELYV